MGEFPVRMARAVGTEGDGLDLYCTPEGLFLGHGYALVGGDLGKSAEGGFRIRPLEELNADLGEGFGLPVNLSERMATLRGIAKALDDGDFSRARIGAAHLDLPPLPDGATALLQRKPPARKWRMRAAEPPRRCIIRNM